MVNPIVNFLRATNRRTEGARVNDGDTRNSTSRAFDCRWYGAPSKKWYPVKLTATRSVGDRSRILLPRSITLASIVAPPIRVNTATLIEILLQFQAREKVYD